METQAGRDSSGFASANTKPTEPSSGVAATASKAADVMAMRIRLKLGPSVLLPSIRDDAQGFVGNGCCRIDELMAEIVARHLVEYLDPAGFVVMKRPIRLQQMPGLDT
jgi:hypothetical protein